MGDISLRDALLLFRQGAQDFGFAEVSQKANARALDIRNQQEKALISEETARIQLQETAQQFALAGVATGKGAAEVKLGAAAIAPKSKEGLAADDLQKAILGQMTAFDRRKDVSNIREVMGVTERLRSTLKVADRSAFNGAVKNLIKMTDQRITDQDFRLGLPKLNVIDRLDRLQRGFFTGEATQAEKDVVIEIAGEIEKAGRFALSNKAKFFARSRAPVLGVPSATFEGLLAESLGTTGNIQQGKLDFTDRVIQGAITPTQKDLGSRGFQKTN